MELLWILLSAIHLETTLQTSQIMLETLFSTSWTGSCRQKNKNAKFLILQNFNFRSTSVPATFLIFSAVPCPIYRSACEETCHYRTYLTRPLTNMHSLSHLLPKPYIHSVSVHLVACKNTMLSQLISLVSITVSVRWL